MMKHKKLGKKFLSFALSAIMLFALLPATVFAAEKNTPTRTTKLDVSKLTETTDMLASEGWKWVPTADGGTLTLRNCYILSQAQETEVVRFPSGNVTIMLEGQNTLKMSSVNLQPMICSGGGLDLTIAAGTEDGKLSLLRQDTSMTESNPYGIAANSINVKSGNIYTNTDFCVIANDFVMQNGSLTVDSANITDGVGIYSAAGDISISGGSVDIATGQIGIFIPGNIGTKDQKVSLTGGDVKIRNGIAAIAAKNITVDTDGAIDLQGSKTTLHCNKTGGALEILSAGSLTLNGGQKPYLPEVTGGGITVTIGNAGYAAVDELIDEANGLNPDNFVTSLSDVEAAVNAVTRGKSILEQNTVNGYATAIKNAIAALKYKDADYTKVDEALAKIPSDLSVYTEADLKALNDAKNAVVRGKNITEQAIVDGYAAALENALTELKKKPVISITNPETGAKIEYEDGSLFDTNIVLSVTSKPQAEMDKFKDGVDKSAPGLTLSGLYDVKLLKDGVTIQPNGNIKVSIPLTDAMKDMTDLQVVYIDDNGNVTIIPSEVKDGKIVFVTDHFSYYGVVGKAETAGSGTPQTGDNTPVLPLTLLVLAFGTVLVILGEKRKMFE